jgi:hypothetical protein
MNVASVVVVDHGRRFITTDAARAQNPVPILGISRASGGADVQAFVESAKTVEDLTAKGHACARAYSPDRAASPPGLLVERRAIVAAFCTWAPSLLKLLRRGFAPPENLPCDGPDRGCPAAACATKVGCSTVASSV